MSSCTPQSHMNAGTKISEYPPLFVTRNISFRPRDVVIQMLDHIERGRDVECLVIEWQCFREPFLCL